MTKKLTTKLADLLKDKLPKFNQIKNKEMKSTVPVFIKETIHGKNFPTKKTTGSDDFTSEFYQTV